MFLIMFLASKSWHFPKEILGLLCFLFLILKSYMLLIFSTSFSLLDTLSVRVKPNELIVQCIQLGLEYPLLRVKSNIKL